jgi:hypothetical protein
MVVIGFVNSSLMVFAMEQSQENDKANNPDSSFSSLIKKITTPLARLASSHEEVQLVSFPLLSQKEAESYRSSEFMKLEDSLGGDTNKSSQVENLACLATVYVMLARGTTNKRAVVEDYYADPRKYNGNGPGATKPSFVKDETPVNISIVIDSIQRGSPVILHGKGGPLFDHFILVTGYKRYDSGDIELLANDPWPDASQGLQVVLNASEIPIAHPNLSQIKFVGMRIADVSSKEMQVNFSNKGPCEIRVADLQGKYRGTCQNGLANGNGKAEGKSKTFTGVFVSGVPQGKGELIETSLLSGSSTTVGNFVNGKIEGKGKRTYSNGNVYEGEFLNDMPNGKGKLVRTDGAIYIGNFLSGKYSGYGVMTEANGSKYEGNWFDGMRHGKGKITYPGQKSIAVEYANGKAMTPGVEQTLSSSKTGGQNTNHPSNYPVGNIADEFYRNPGTAIKKYSSWQEISITVRGIEARDGFVILTDTQAPSSLTSESNRQSRGKFNWDDFHQTAVMGQNVYAQVTRVACVVNMSSFSKMNVNKGATIRLQAKLGSYNGGGSANNSVVFDCK